MAHPDHNGSIKSWISLFRLPNLVLIALFFVLVDAYLLSAIRAVIGADPALSTPIYGLFILDVLIATLCGYWMNDYYDYEVDRINKPTRALPMQVITPKQLLRWIILLGLAGFCLTLFLGIAADRLQWIWLYPVTIFALLLYAKYGKRWGVFGNVVVSFLIAALPLLLVLIEWHSLVKVAQFYPLVAQNILSIITGYFALMFLANLAREIAKDAEDHEGDSLVGSTSIAQRYGIKGVQWSLYLLFLSIASVQWGLFSALPFSWALLITCYLITIILVGLSVLTAITRQHHGFKKVSLLLKVLMIGGLLELLTLPHII